MKQKNDKKINTENANKSINDYLFIVYFVTIIYKDETKNDKDETK